MNLSKVSITYILLFINLVFIFITGLLGEKAQISLSIPLFIAILFAFLFFYVINKVSKDKFIPKIFLITCLFHFIVAIFIQILKYHILNLPTLNGVAGIGIDNDNALYQSQAVAILNNFYYIKESTLFSVIVAGIYKIFGINEFSACCFNCLISGFISTTIYKLGLNLYNNKFYASMLGYFIAFSFTIAAYTSVLMRDVYIMLLSYLIIYFYYLFYKKKNFLDLLFVFLSFFILCFFRAYAASAVLGACIAAHLIIISSLKLKNNKIKINKYMLITMILSAVILLLCVIYQEFLRIDYIISLFDMETILEVSEVGYGNANSSFGINRVALSKCLPLFLFVGYFCMFFAPFPHQWLLSKNIVQAFSASETILLYIFLIPSFFISIVKGFKEKNFIIIAAFLYIFFVFTFYGMILDNSGAVFRGRAPFIPLIYLIALYKPGGLLLKIVNKIEYYNSRRKNFYEKSIINKW